MPIRINLFHEEERALKERKRDPLKLGLLATLGLILCQIIYWLFLSGTAAGKNSEVARLQADWEKLRDSTEAGQSKLDEMKSKLDVYEMLHTKVVRRHFWAPILQQLLEGARLDVQLTEVNCSLSLEGNIRLTVHGLTAGQEPRGVAEYLRDATERALKTIHPESAARFELLEENPQLMEINGRRFRNARFIIDCRIAKPDKKEANSEHAQKKSQAR